MSKKQIEAILENLEKQAIRHDCTFERRGNVAVFWTGYGPDDDRDRVFVDVDELLAVVNNPQSNT